MPADDLTDPAPATTFAHLDATTVLSRGVAERGIYPAVDPLDSTSRIMDPNVIGAEHYGVARDVQKLLQDYKSLQDIIAILGMDELSEEVSFCFLDAFSLHVMLIGYFQDKIKVARARKIERFLSQPFQVLPTIMPMKVPFTLEIPGRRGVHQQPWQAGPHCRDHLRIPGTNWN